MSSDFKGTIIFLHGFGSVGDSAKSRALKAEYGEQNVIAPDLPLDPKAVVKLISDIVRSIKRYPILFVGTSLGGFYANYFAQKFDCPGILVNPATVPSRTLYNRIGYNKNFATGEDFLWEPDFVKELGKMEKDVSTVHSGGLVNLFVAKDDDVIDHRETLQNYPYTAHCAVYQTGGHRFEENWGDVVAHVRKILS